MGITPIMPEGMSLKDMKLAGQVSAESGVPLDNLLSELHRKVREINDKKISPDGKYRVLGVDRFEGADWIHGDFDTAEEAIRIATEKTDEANKFTSGPSVATVFYAYDPSGQYIGGNTWNNE